MIHFLISQIIVHTVLDSKHIQIVLLKYLVLTVLVCFYTHVSQFNFTIK